MSNKTILSIFYVLTVAMLVSVVYLISDLVRRIIHFGWPKART